MSTTISLFDQAAIDNAVAEFGPAEVVVSGKTTTDKRMSVVQSGSTAVRLFASSMKGKVGTEARSGLQMQGMAMIASKARQGNYKPLAEALSLITAESIVITNRASFESLKDRYAPMLVQLERDGKRYSKAGKETTRYLALAQCLSLIQATYDGVAAIIAQEQSGE